MKFVSFSTLMLGICFVCQGGDVQLNTSEVSSSEDTGLAMINASNADVSLLSLKNSSHLRGLQVIDSKTITTNSSSSLSNPLDASSTNVGAPPSQNATQPFATQHNSTTIYVETNAEEINAKEPNEEVPHACPNCTHSEISDEMISSAINATEAGLIITPLDESKTEADGEKDEIVHVYVDKLGKKYEVRGINTVTHQNVPIFAPMGLLMYSTMKVRLTRVAVRTAVKTIYNRTAGRTNVKIANFRNASFG